MSLGPALKPLDGSATTAQTEPGPDAKRLARAAGEFESMLLLQMLREMRKSGSWKDENEDKDGFGAATLFDTLDQELAAYITKGHGFGLQQSLVKQMLGGGETPATPIPVTLPSLNLPTTDVIGTDSRGRGASDPPHDQEAPAADLLADRVTTSPFGWRRDPFSGAATYHRGVDLRAAYGEPIGAADAGTVVFAGEQGGYGQTVVVEHAGGVRTRYAHLSSVTAQVGTGVKAGEAIGLAGRSGRATGTHLHFEVTQNGRHIDPQAYRPGGLKLEAVSADWGGGTEPASPGFPQRGSASE